MTDSKLNREVGELTVSVKHIVAGQKALLKELKAYQVSSKKAAAKTEEENDARFKAIEDNHALFGKGKAWLAGATFSLAMVYYAIGSSLGPFFGNIAQKLFKEYG